MTGFLFSMTFDPNHFRYFLLEQSKLRFFICPQGLIWCYETWTVGSVLEWFNNKRMILGLLKPHNLERKETLYSNINKISVLKSVVLLAFGKYVRDKWTSPLLSTKNLKSFRCSHFKSPIAYLGEKMCHEVMAHFVANRPPVYDIIEHLAERYCSCEVHLHIY